MNFLKTLDKLIRFLLKWITLTCFFALTIIVTVVVISRYSRGFISLLWSDEVIEMLFAYMIFLGSAYLWITKEHFSAGKWIEEKLIKKDVTKHKYKLFLELVGFLFIGIFFYYSLNLTINASSVSNILRVPEQVTYSCMPIAGFIMVCYSIQNLVVEMKAISQAKRQQQTTKIAL